MAATAATATRTVTVPKRYQDGEAPPETAPTASPPGAPGGDPPPAAEGVRPTRTRSHGSSSSGSSSGGGRSPAGKSPSPAAASAPARPPLPPMSDDLFGLEEAPTFRPTEEEFEDPYAYIEKIRKVGERAGICKIIPPASWKPPFCVDVEHFKFRTRLQRLNDLDANSKAQNSYLDGLQAFWENQGQPMHRLPQLDRRPVNLFVLRKEVERRGGLATVTERKQWADIGRAMGFSRDTCTSLSHSLKSFYVKWIQPYDVYLQQQQQQQQRGPAANGPAPAKNAAAKTGAAAVAATSAAASSSGDEAKSAPPTNGSSGGRYGARGSTPAKAPQVKEEPSVVERASDATVGVTDAAGTADAASGVVDVDKATADEDPARLADADQVPCPIQNFGVRLQASVLMRARIRRSW